MPIAIIASSRPLMKPSIHSPSGMPKTISCVATRPAIVATATTQVASTCLTPRRRTAATVALGAQPTLSWDAQSGQLVHVHDADHLPVAVSVAVHVPAGPRSDRLVTPTAACPSGAQS